VSILSRLAQPSTLPRKSASNMTLYGKRLGRPSLILNNSSMSFESDKDHHQWMHGRRRRQLIRFVHYPISTIGASDQREMLLLVFVLNNTRCNIFILANTGCNILNGHTTPRRRRHQASALPTASRAHHDYAGTVESTQSMQC